MRYIIVFLLLTFVAEAFANQQSAYLSPQCPRSPEGMVLFARGADLDFGRKGTAPSNSRAEAYYEKALRLVPCNA